MSSIILFLGLFLTISCTASILPKAYWDSIPVPKSVIDTNKAELEACRYYYTRYWEEMVNYSLKNGFSYDDQFGQEDSYGIVQATYKLAISGDTIVESAMFDFLDRLANLQTPYLVDASIHVLIGFYLGLDDENLFNIGIEFLNPEHIDLNEKSMSDGGGDHTLFVYLKLLDTMDSKDRSYYSQKFLQLFTSVMDENILKDMEVSLRTWKEFYPYLVEELKANNIQFRKN